ncbi:MAG TPA: FtsX-like permease family protein [Thermoanaerobaculia bacterium]|nr:FtsX-like permease family protein [Thermoanaerobaculia bacterium]
MPREIVGVAGDVRRDGLAVAAKPEMYAPFGQEPWWAAYVVIRTTGDPVRLSADLRNEVRALAPSLPIDGVQPMTQIVYESVAQPRFRTSLIGLFAAAALLLAVVGIYGVISYSVGRRTREVGIRLALGASRADVLQLILRQGFGLAVVGLAVGAAGAAVLTRFLASLLFDVSRLDVATYGGVALLLLAAALLACWIPARRAMKIDPVEALRVE